MLFSNTFRGRTFIGLLLVVRAIPAAVAPSSSGARDIRAEWIAEFARADRLVDEGKYGDAAEAFGAALLLAEEIGPRGIETGLTLNNFGHDYQHLGRFREAEAWYSRSVAVLEPLLGHNDPIVIRVAGNLASVWIVTGQRTRAERLIRRFVDPYANAQDSPSHGVLLAFLATTMIQEHQYADAERSLRRAVGALEPAPDYGESLALALVELARLCELTVRHQQAMEYSKRAMDILGRVVRPTPETVVATMSTRALLCGRDGALSTAEDLFTTAIFAAENELGSQHPVLIRVLSEYAEFLRQLKRKTEARKLEKRAATIIALYRKEDLGRYKVDVKALLHTSR
jgi:tetratricopeptide (TPR) repeat protein